MIKNALYYKDSYLKEFDTEVIDLIKDNDKIKVVLKETAFYPEGGGQPSDIGLIDDSKVLFVEEKGNVIYHTVDKEIEVGKKVHCKIDFENRFYNMQAHTGEHIVSGLIVKKFEATNVGFHIGHDFITMDFNKVLTNNDIREIEEKANKVVFSNLKVEINVYPNEVAKKMEYRSKIDLNDDVRIVNIPGVDVCACCGTHVNYTGEIGAIKLVKFEKYKSGVRIYLLVGQKAINDYTDKYDTVNKISTLLSLKIDEVYDGVVSLKDEVSRLHQEISKMEMEKIENTFKDITSDYYVYSKENLDMNELKKYCNCLLKYVNKVAITISDNRFVIMSNNVDLKELLNNLKEKISIKGGGNSNIIQGQFEGTNEKFEENLIKLI